MSIRKKARHPVLPAPVRAYIREAATRRAMLTAQLAQLPTSRDFVEVLGIGVGTVTRAVRGHEPRRPSRLEERGHEMLQDLKTRLKAKGLEA